MKANMYIPNTIVSERNVAIHRSQIAIHPIHPLNFHTCTIIDKLNISIQHSQILFHILTNFNVHFKNIFKT